MDEWVGNIRIQTTSFRGKNYIDIRKYYFDKATHEKKPTTKGLMIGNYEVLDSILKTVAGKSTDIKKYLESNNNGGNTVEDGE